MHIPFCTTQPKAKPVFIVDYNTGLHLGGRGAPLDFHECDIKVNTTCYIVLHVRFFEATLD